LSEEQAEPESPPEEAAQKPHWIDTTLVVVGWLAAVFVPLPLGILFGAILDGRNDKRGRIIIGVSVAMIVVQLILLWMLIDAANDNPSYFE
jgi:hypothetical protein